MLKVYTKDKCVYCHFLVENLDEWGLEYTVVHNEPLPVGYNTYPQLYYNETNIQKGSSTDLTLKIINERIDDYNSWAGQDSGIEGQL
jgi:glutaredoxin